MIRKLFLLATLATSVGLFAQGAMPANQPGTNVYVVGGGLYGGGVYVAPGPAVAPGPNAGISLAGRAGISLNEPMQLGVRSTLVPSWPPYPYGAYAGYAGGYYGVPEAGAETVGVAPGPAVPDLGPSYAVSEEPQKSPFSLGEVAAYYKLNRHQNVRTYTNTDAQHLTNTVIIPRTKPGGTTTVPAPQKAPPPR